MQTPEDRLAAYRADEAAFWYRAHVERDFPFTAIPLEYREQVFELIKAHNRPFGETVP